MVHQVYGMYTSHGRHLNILKEPSSSASLHIEPKSIGGNEDTSRGEQLSHCLLNEGHVHRDSVGARGVVLENGGSQSLCLFISLLEGFQLQLYVCVRVGVRYCTCV